MKIFITLLLISIHLTNLGCKERITYEERDRRLQKGYELLNTNNKNEKIKGIHIIKKYPTMPGLYKLLDYWESNSDKEIEEEILNTIDDFEAFTTDGYLIEEIFNKNYSRDISHKKKQKLIRLLKRTNVDNKHKLINVIEKEI